MPNSSLTFRSTCRLLVLLSAVAATGISLGCRPTTATTPAKTVSPDTWAVVDGRDITREQVDKAFRRTRDASQTLSSEEEMTAKLSLLNDLILQDILVAKAAALKIVVPDTDLD